MKDKLLILDISGFLCAKIADTQYQSPYGFEVIRQHYYSIILRPGLTRFLQFCFDNYDVGFLSSSMYNTVDPLLEAILTEEQKQQTRFRWYRDRVEMDPDIGKPDAPEGVDAYSTIKRISTIIDNDEINPPGDEYGYGRTYHMFNVLICDDSKHKTRFNPDSNVIVTDPFTVNTAKDNYLDHLTTNVIPQRFDQLHDEMEAILDAAYAQ